MAGPSVSRMARRWCRTKCGSTRGTWRPSCTPFAVRQGTAFGRQSAAIEEEVHRADRRHRGADHGAGPGDTGQFAGSGCGAGVRLKLGQRSQIDARKRQPDCPLDPLTVAFAVLVRRRVWSVLPSRLQNHLAISSSSNDRALGRRHDRSCTTMVTGSALRHSGTRIRKESVACCVCLA